MSVPNFDRKHSITTWIAVKQLSVTWAKAQRDFNERHAAKIAAEFDPDLFGVLAVTLPNGDGIYHVIDGQHRRAAIQKLYGDNEKVPCYIYEVDDAKTAAKMFDVINTGRRPVSALNKFTIRTEAGYETEVAITKIVKDCGYRIGSNMVPRTIRGVSSLTFVYRRFGPQCLGQTLNVLSATFGDDANACDSILIAGYGAFLAENGHANLQRLIENVQKKYTPGKLMAGCISMSDIHHVNRPEGLKMLLRQIYNVGLKESKKLVPAHVSKNAGEPQ